jgi:hypothetical protein
MTSLVRISESGRKEEKCKILRKINGIPGRKQQNLTAFSATDEECAVKIFLIIFRRDVLEEERKMPDEIIVMKKILQIFRDNGTRWDIFQTCSNLTI